MTDALYPLALAGIGLPLVIGAVAVTARTLVYRHADQHGQAIADAARDLPTVAEAARARQAEVERLLADTRTEEVVR